MEEIKVRTNLNEIVKEIALKKVKTRYAEHKICEVKFKNNEVVEFADTEGLYDLNTSYKRAGKDAFKTVKLVEEIQAVVEDEKDPKYICVAFECINGETYRLFPSKRTDKARINLFYDILAPKTENK